MTNNVIKLLSENAINIKGNIMGKIRLTSSGEIALVNYAAQVLYEIDTRTAMHTKVWNFEKFGIWEVFPSKNDWLVPFLLHDDNYGVLDLSQDTKMWVEQNKKASRTSIALSNDSKLMAVICGNSLFIHDASTGKELLSIPVKGNGESKVLFDPSGNIITHMNLDNLTAYKLPTGEKIWEIEVSGGAGYDIWEFSHNGELFGMCNLDQVGKICKTDSGEKVGFLKKGNDEKVNEIHFSDDDTKVITCSCDRSVRVWEVGSSTLIHDLHGHNDNLVESVVPLNNFAKAISFTMWDNTFYLWDLETGAFIDKISFDFTVHDYKVIQTKNRGTRVIVVGLNDYKMDSTINLINKKPMAIHICKFGF